MRTSVSLGVVITGLALSVNGFGGSGNILGGGGGGSSSSNGVAAGGYYGNNSAAIAQLKANANDILMRTTQAMQAAQAMQQAARNLSLQSPTAVRNGLSPGGLQVATGAHAGWQNANLPVQSVANGQVTVTIQQTAPQALLNWQTFNVGKNTTAYFNQSAGGSSAHTWVALNQIWDSSPSQILGSIKAQGQVYLINQNGILFGGSSQINVGSLFAAAITTPASQLMQNGLYQSFAAGPGSIAVQRGAQIATNAPSAATSGGGFVILLADSVTNAGIITTPNGQTLMAAGQSLLLRQGYSIGPSSSTQNTTSTTVGTEAEVTNGGDVTNSGLIESTTGDITMVGGQVTQAGIAITTTSVAKRGTIHLLTDATDSTTSVTLAPGSITLIEPDPNSGLALDPQRANAYSQTTAYLGLASVLNDEVGLPDQIGLSRIEITTGGTVNFATNSLTSATAGQIEVSAGKKVFTAGGAELDVSGLVGVTLPMSANDLAVNIQGYELRDDPLNRDTKTLFNSTVWVNINQLVEVPASSAYSQNRFYTSGGLFEVSGELNNVEHSINEWSTIGGSIVLSAPKVVAQAGSVFDIAGGTINYQSGYLKQSWLIGQDGRFYNANTASASLTYAGVWNGFHVNHPRWNVVETYQDSISLPAQIYQSGYTVGRDAGSLTIYAPGTLFAGTIQAGTYIGSQQNASRPSTVGDPFLLPQNVVPLNGSLVVGRYGTETVTSSGTSVLNPNTNNVVFSNEPVSTPDSPNAPLPADARNTDLFSAQQINAAQLGGLTVDIEAPPPATTTTTGTSSGASTGKGRLTIEAPLTFASGAQITLTAAAIDMDAGIIARGGNVSITSDAYSLVVGTGFAPTPVSGIGIDLAPGAVIDTRGLWTNAELDPYDIGDEAYINGGSVSLVSDRGLILGTGSLIDASSGGEISSTGKISGGAGGNITVEGDLTSDANDDQVIKSPVQLDGTLRSYGVTHGGALTLRGHSFLIANQPTRLRKNQIWIAPSFFDQGFSSYTLLGLTGVTVAPGTQITVTEPVYQIPLVNPNVPLNVPTGANPSEAFGSPALMPVYLSNPVTDRFTQRPGASLTLEAGVNHVVRTTSSGKVVSGVTVGGITMGTRAAIAVDPGQSVILAGNGQITVDGAIIAPSGSILIGNTRSLGGGEATFNVGALSIWIGSNSKLNVSGEAITAVDTLGRVFGFVTGAGSIFLGGFGTPSTTVSGADFGEAPYQALAPNLPVTASEEAPTDAFVIVRPGAQLDAQGSAAVVNTKLLPVGGFLGAKPVLTNSSLTPIASNGGTITFDSFTSIFMDGSMNARGGGNGASGGSLTVDLFAPHYDTGLWNGIPPDDMIDPSTLNPIYGSDPARTNYLVPDRMRHLRIITIGSNPQGSGLSSNLQPGQLNPKLIAGKAYLSTQMLAAAGFANLILTGGDGVVFKGNVTLRMPESISLSTAFLADAKVAGQATVIAPYVLLNAIGGSNSLAESLVNGNGTVYGPAPLGPKNSSSFYSTSLTVDADLIDLESTNYNIGSQVQPDTITSIGTGIIQFGASISYTIANGSIAQVNYATFPQITLVSQGDIRFLAGSTGGGTFSAPGNLSLIAAQIYPATGAQWTVEAGQDPVPNQIYYMPGTSITIGRVNVQTPAVPDSVFGELNFQAATINQGGIVRAPLGDLTFQEEKILEANGQSISSNSGLNFLPGSVTSVSANGLTMQYGGTTNGSVYTVNGNSITLYNPLTGYVSGFDPTTNSSASSFQLGIHLYTTGALLTVDKGALLDLSGGGNLTGAGFISGEGGSVDILSTPLANANPILNSFSSSANSVYAIVPGFQGYAPVAGGTSTAYSGGIPSVGQQITLPSGIPGLAAGTYTLLPANYALLPGGFRVELGRNSSFTQAPLVSIGNGSYLVQSYSAIANTGFHGTTPIQTIVTPGIKVRDYSDYDEESYSSFIIAQGQQYSRPRAMIPADASLLSLTFGIPNSPALAMQFQGTANFAPANGGISGSLLISGGNSLEILGPGSAPTPGWAGVSAAAADIDAIGAPNVFIGGFLDPVSSQILGFYGPSGGSIVLRKGAVLTGAQVDLISPGPIVIEAGAGIDTLGRGAPNVDSSQGYLFTNSIPVQNSTPNIYSVVVVSNGYVDMAPGAGSGSNVNIEVDSGASFYSEGTIGFAAPGNLVLGTAVNYGARYIDFAIQDVSIGSQSALNNAQARGTLQPGLILTQDLLSSLLRGNPAIGAPALQMLTLAASQSVNFYGSVDLTTIDPATGKSSLQELVLNTPAVYGAGASGDVATITTETLVWNGLGQVVTQLAGSSAVTVIADTPPGPAIANGPGTGSGTLNIVADQIIFGYAPTDQPQNNTSLSRLALGFSTVNFTATQITANNKGTLSVYQTQTGVNYSGGNLNLITPLLTGDSGSVMNYKAGGALTLSSPPGISPVTTMPDSLGAEINLSASSISDSTSIMAGTGKVTLTASGDINLLSGSRIDVSGRVVPLFDQNVATWGGDIALESTQGSVIQSAGSIINVSAVGNDAGTLDITATGGQVQIAGILLGSTTGNFNAGSFNVRAQTIGDFVALNALLDTGGFYYSRIFDIKQGDLTIPAGATIRATDVEISTDNGSLTVAGTINASGAKPGTIRLSAGNNLELTPTSVLDVHNTVLQVDSYGQPIDAENRGTIELTVADGSGGLNNGRGSLLLDAGAVINMTSPDGVPRGDLELNVPRTGETSGDIRISAAGPLNISGAQTIALNAFWTYAPTDPNGTIVQSAGSEVPTGAVILDVVNTASVAFINAAETNANLQSRLTGLTAYGANYHLRPGVEIVSATPSGSLTIDGDIDLSRYRYGPNADANPSDPSLPGYGAGEPGVLVIRAGGNLNIYGSITDGFQQPPATPDDNGWVLYSGQTTQDIVVPIQVILGSGTTYAPDNIALNYTLTNVTGATVSIAYITDATVTGTNPAGQSVTIRAGQIVPVGTALTSIPAGTNLSVFSNPSGSTSISLQSDQTVPAGGLIPQGANISFDSLLQNHPVLSGAAGSYIVLRNSAGVSGSAASSPNNQGATWAIAAMLPPGDLSWSIRLVAGADTSAADTRTLIPASQLQSMATTSNPNPGSIVLSDLHYMDPTNASFSTYDPENFSVLRTGTGNLDLLAGGNFSEESVYGIYTAGTQSPGITPSSPFNLGRDGLASDGTITGSAFTTYNQIADTIANGGTYQANYPQNGGNLFLAAQEDVTGFTTFNGAAQPSAMVGYWLWRQGGAEINQQTAWWINFGTYAYDVSTGGPVLIGFTGIGTLGGGNVTIDAGRNAGVTIASFSSLGNQSGSLVVAVGATGRVQNGALVQTGGGDATIDVGEGLNPAFFKSQSQSGQLNVVSGGEFANVRGDITIKAGSVGGLYLSYGGAAGDDPRAISPFEAGLLNTSFLNAGVSPLYGGPILVPGDSSITIQSRGDLVVSAAGDPGRVPDSNATNATLDPSSTGEGYTWFSLWTQSTSIRLYSAGGNLSPIVSGEPGEDDLEEPQLGPNSTVYLYPPTLTAIATSGSAYFFAGFPTFPATGLLSLRLELAPAPNGQFELLAGKSVYGDPTYVSETSYAPPFQIDVSGADPSQLPTPFNPAWYLYPVATISQSVGVGGPSLFGTYATNGNTSPNGNANNPSQAASGQAYQGPGALFAFEADSATGVLHVNDPSPALIYAVTGDIVDLGFGQLFNAFSFQSSSTGYLPWYIMAKAAQIRAGRDIVNFGQSSSLPPQHSTNQANYILNNSQSDVSVISAGRDILFANVDIYGPGNLEVSAGRNITQAGQESGSVVEGVLDSKGLLGNARTQNPNGGAGIITLVGVGSNGPDWTAFENLYLNPANLANSSGLLVDQPGKVVQTYQDELYTWLQQNYHFMGSEADELAYFESLPIPQQSVFLLQVYFSELNQTGLDYNDPTSRFYQTYVRGEEAIQTLFPSVGPNGQPIGYNGSLTMFSQFSAGASTPGVYDSSILTEYGGGITVVDPGGQVLVGAEGVIPGSTAGILTEGAGDINIYSKGSVLLGLARILTTFGGNIVIWSQNGDINAGKGSKGTVIFAPVGVSYDEFANLTLSPTVPSSGAGIGTLQPIPDVPPGDVNLVAPNGTIDLGEAGVRASGNANLAARVIINAANITVAGKVTGLPTVVGPNVAAVTAANNAVGATTDVANEFARQQVAPSPTPGSPSVIIVEVLGYGGGD